MIEIKIGADGKGTVSKDGIEFNDVASITVGKIELNTPITVLLEIYAEGLSIEIEEPKKTTEEIGYE